MLWPFNLISTNHKFSSSIRVQDCSCCENISWTLWFFSGISQQSLSQTSTSSHVNSCSSLLYFLERKRFSVLLWLLTWPLPILRNLFHRPNSAVFLFCFVFGQQTYGKALHEKQPCFKNDKQRRIWSENLHSYTPSTNNQFLIFINNNQGL